MRADLNLPDSDSHPLNEVLDKSMVALVKLVRERVLKQSVSRPINHDRCHSLSPLLCLLQLRDAHSYHELALVPHLSLLLNSLLDYVLPSSTQRKGWLLILSC